MTKLALIAASALALALGFGLTPEALRLGPVPGALVLVSLAIGVACAASGGFPALAIASGATAGFASAVLAPSSAAAAGGVLFGLAYAERTARIRSPLARLVHLGAALTTGALAGVIVVAYANPGIPPAVRIVAVVVAAVLSSLPMMVDADDATAHTLDGIASGVGEPSRSALRVGADLRRTAHEILLDGATARGVHTTWRALVRLAEARHRLERSGTTAASASRASGSTTHPVIEMVDTRIREHVAALARAYTAVDAARAARVGLDDAALRNVTNAGETFEDESLALVHVGTTMRGLVNATPNASPVSDASREHSGAGRASDARESPQPTRDDVSHDV